MSTHVTVHAGRSERETFEHQSRQARLDRIRRNLPDLDAYRREQADKAIATIEDRYRRGLSIPDVT